MYLWIKEFPPLSESDPAPVIKTASVILAAHNEHKYLERTINSIFDQSDPDQLIEIIVVDDASEPPLSEITNKLTSESFGEIITYRKDTKTSKHRYYPSVAVLCFFLLPSPNELHAIYLPISKLDLFA